MSQLWALVKPEGGFTLHYTPDQTPPVSEGLERIVRLSREPDQQNGETVNYDQQALVFDLQTVMDRVMHEIKMEAGRRIELVAPLWKQINDSYTPANAASQDRRQQINLLRDWSQEMEDRLAGVTSSAQLKALRSELS